MHAAWSSWVEKKSEEGLKLQQLLHPVDHPLHQQLDFKVEDEPTRLPGCQNEMWDHRHVDLAARVTTLDVFKETWMILCPWSLTKTGIIMQTIKSKSHNMWVFFISKLYFERLTGCCTLLIIDNSTAELSRVIRSWAGNSDPQRWHHSIMASHTVNRYFCFVSRVIKTTLVVTFTQLIWRLTEVWRRQPTRFTASWSVTSAARLEFHTTETWATSFHLSCL